MKRFAGIGSSLWVGKGAGMWHAICQTGQKLAVAGVMVVSGSMASGKAASETALHFSCASSAGVDAALLSEICADFRDLLKAQPGYRVLDTDGDAPGLEIDVTRATETQLEVVPTWIAASGVRTTLPSTGTVVVDTSLTQTMRRDLFLRVLATPPL